MEELQLSTLAWLAGCKIEHERCRDARLSKSRGYTGGTPVADFVILSLNVGGNTTDDVGPTANEAIDSDEFMKVGATLVRVRHSRWINVGF